MFDLSDISLKFLKYNSIHHQYNASTFWIASAKCHCLASNILGPFDTLYAWKLMVLKCHSDKILKINY